MAVYLAAHASFNSLTEHFESTSTSNWSPLDYLTTTLIFPASILLNRV
jgi:hypothetical protein